MLVINKTRGMQLKKLTNSPFLKEWAKAGQIAIKPGIGNGKAQIIITAVQKEFTGEEIDEMLTAADRWETAVLGQPGAAIFCFLRHVPKLRLNWRWSLKRPSMTNDTRLGMGS
jgi:hypothetical protein